MAKKKKRERVYGNQPAGTAPSDPERQGAAPQGAQQNTPINQGMFSGS